MFAQYKSINIIIIIISESACLVTSAKMDQMCSTLLRNWMMKQVRCYRS